VGQANELDLFPFGCPADVVRIHSAPIRRFYANHCHTGRSFGNYGHALPENHPLTQIMHVSFSSNALSTAAFNAARTGC